MGYRFEDKPKPKPDDLLPVFDMYNNEKRTWSFPCFYLDVEKPIDWHDYKMHDFLGWPQPNKPGHICQAVPDYGSNTFSPASVWKYVDMSKAVKIDLTSEYEGYSRNGVVSFDESDDFDSAGPGELSDLTYDIEATATVRQDEPWIVDVAFQPHLSKFSGDPHERVFNVYLVGDTNDRYDLLVRGKLMIYPG